MKHLTVSLILLVSILVTGSCKKVVPSNFSSFKITLKVDGVKKEASGEKNVFCTLYKDLNSIQIIGNIGGSNSESINLSISEFHGVGEYNAETSAFIGSYNTQLDFNHSYLSSEGTVKVTSYTNDSIKGEFHFKSENPAGEAKTIAEGKFECKVFSM
jgi:hypothetical protein